jgi:hypothetical protein
VLLLEHRKTSIQDSCLGHRILEGFGNLYSPREKFFLDNGAVKVELYFCHSLKFDEADRAAADVNFNFSIGYNQGSVKHIHHYPFTMRTPPSRLYISSLARWPSSPLTSGNTVWTLLELANLVHSVKRKT